MRIIVPSYNNAEWAEYNIASILNQTYQNYEVIYIDDASTDDTVKLVTKYINGDPRFRIHRNDVNRGAMYNYFETGIEDLEDDTIVIHLDGDDWLIDIFVLEKLNDWYNKHDSWMTYGKMYVYRGELDVQESNPQNTPHPDYVHEHKLYRKDTWRASHMRTYRGFLLKAINKEDLIDKVTGEYYWEASDLSFQYPCMEMCPKEKIGVVDFPTYIYNAAPAQTVRTAARQHSNRHHEVELEIRNKKHYKEGVFGETLPQINVLGYNQESSYIPKNFSFVYGLEDGEFDATLITDYELLPYIRGERKLNRGKVIADLHESPIHDSTMTETYQAVYDNADMFDLILTYDEKLLTLPNAKLRMCMWRTFLTTYHTSNDGRIHPPEDWMIDIHDKSKDVSCISSNKNVLEGHRKRLEFVNHIRDTHNNVHLFGAGFNQIAGKIDALKDYRFSVAIENAYIPNWATEKLSDCFLTGTVPIYYGCPNVGDYFNTDGILTFTTKEELDSIINRINNNSVGLYESMRDAIQENFETAKKYSLNMDDVFEKYIKEIL